MKLLILTQYFPPEVGAPQARLSEIARRLHDKGMEVSVLTSMPNYPQMRIHEAYKGKRFCKEHWNGITVYRTYIYVHENKAIIRRLLNYFSFVLSSLWYGVFKIKGKYDVILVESPPLFLGLSGYLLSRYRRAKLVFNVSDLWPESAEKLGLIRNKFLLRMAACLESFCYRKSVMVSGQTQGIVNNISNRFPGVKVHWLKNGIDISKYAIEENDNGLSLRGNNDLSSRDFILLYGGIIGYAQGLDVILQTADILRYKTDIKFVLLGNGPEKSRLEALKTEMNLTNVFFYDAVAKHQMRQIIKEVDAGLVPLRRLDLFKGAIPSKIFEYLALEKPILLGVEGEAEDLFIKQGKSGLAFEPDNAKDLSDKILLLYNNKEEAKKMGERGKEYAKINFSLDNIVNELYEKLIELK
ncbi:MAG: glycosyltransferase family 4 protein [Bacteroidales bacterium]|jgi:glycosyltransferase involved in cell wall biosynthesis|nr:glycosyltransferase family 4 protein [Bacteroidales bacterium]